MHLILISSVLPSPTSAGEILLHRHLSQLPPDWSIECHGPTSNHLGFWSLLRKIFGFMGRISLLKPVTESFFIFAGARWIDATLPDAPPQDTLVLTVAHGDICHAAARFARRHKLPLIIIFHDWWPDIPRLPGLIRQYADLRFRHLARQSRLNFCVSPGMIRHLGDPPHAFSLPPIPETAPPPEPPNPTPPFTIRYLGNLHEYGPMLHLALTHTLQLQEIRLEVRGSHPAWPEDFTRDMTAHGHYLPHAPRKELHHWLNSAHALLVTQSFEPAHRRRMETSFPSKLTDYCAYARPIIIWAPPWASSVSWAATSRAALTITDPDPAALTEAMLHLAGDPGLQHRLSLAAAQAATGEFHPLSIQRKFLEHLMALRPR